MSRVAIYVRVSTRDKGQDVRNQIDQLEAWCQRHGHDVYDIYRDEESGRRGRAERKAFDRMFKDARRGRFDLVLFWALDRFSREGTMQTIHYLRQLDQWGVRFHSLTEDYLSTDNELVRDLLITLLSHFARLESEKISERTKAGIERARANGTKLGRPSKLDAALPVVRELKQQQRLDGELTQKEIAEIVRRRTGTKVSIRTVSRCLRQLQEADHTLQETP